MSLFMSICQFICLSDCSTVNFGSMYLYWHHDLWFWFVSTKWHLMSTSHSSHCVGHCDLWLTEQSSCFSSTGLAWSPLTLKPVWHFHHSNTFVTICSWQPQLHQYCSCQPQVPNFVSTVNAWLTCLFSGITKPWLCQNNGLSVWVSHKMQDHPLLAGYKNYNWVMPRETCLITKDIVA